MSSTGFASFSPIGPIGTTPLPILTTGPSVALPSIPRRPSVTTTTLNPTEQAASAPGGSASTTTAPAPQAHTPVRTTDETHAASGGGTAGATAAAIVDDLATDYSATIDGVQYAASLIQSGGEYTASISSIPGATAIGASELVAENNLATRIDVLV